jgi:hypothetical protein
MSTMLSIGTSGRSAGHLFNASTFLSPIAIGCGRDATIGQDPPSGS